MLLVQAATKDNYRVTNLPGIQNQQNQNKTMHAGNLKAFNGQIFFWRVAGDTKQAQDTTILWLNGGPGCSSMDGGMMEIGPYRVGNGGYNLHNNPNLWTKHGNLLFVDQPFGVGFSKGPLVRNMNDLVRNFMYFLQEYFKLFPEDKNKKFIIAGESYAGTYIPYITHELLNNKMVKVHALAIGNGLIDNYQDLSLLDFSYNHGLLNQQTYGQLSRTQSRCERNIMTCRMPDRLKCLFKNS